MKPAPFSYYRAKSAADAVAHIAGDEDAVFLSGGQSLVPMLNLRLARPSTLIDLNDCAELDVIACTDRTIEIGALTRHHRVATDAAIRSLNPALAHVAASIGYYPIRCRGTMGGSLAHADPAAQWPLLAALFDAPIRLRGPEGVRQVAVRDFLVSVFVTAREQNELVEAALFPVLEADEGWGFAQIARVAGDFAIASAAATIRLASDGRVTSARVAVGAVCDTPIALDGDALAGAMPDDRTFAEFAEMAVAALPVEHGAQISADERRDLARTMVRRALGDAVRRSQELQA